jgi:hypothetical protein
VTIQGGFDLTAKPVVWIAAAFQRGGGEKNEKMGPRGYIPENDPLEVPLAMPLKSKNTSKP